jgi:16S rRNA (cytosine967-C5)-methyltransferase
VAPRAKGFVNAVLRKLAARPLPWPLPEGDSVAAIGVRSSLPDWLVEQFLADLGPADGLATIETLNEPAAVTLRVNPRRATVAAVEQELLDAGAQVSRGELMPDSLRVTGTGDVGALACVRDGRATPQDQASQAVVAVVAPQAGERVLEIGAAPGGKATGLAEAMEDEGLVVAADLHPARTRMIRTAARRLGLTAVAPVAADGRAPGLRAGSFDAVLLDAPCSGLGVLRRRPEARWRLQPETIAEVAALQRELLTAGAAQVRPGGRLVYSVCTLSHAETVAIDEWAVDALAGFRALDPPGPPWQRVGRGARLLPGAADTDGMYCLVLEAPR